ncbi:MAG: hypothetical protein HY537_10955 [Deltaproteobacteria bacterium]|nr:hypothetical protein [Deltaproteobacteria bacterium]
MRTFVVVLCALGVTAFGATYNFPILQKTLGGMDKKDGVVISKSCQIFDDQPELKLEEVLKLISEADKAPLSKFVHVVREIPSVEVWANSPTRGPGGPAVTVLYPRKVLLLEDSSSGRQRAGAAAETLMKLVDKLCKNL